MKFSYEKFFSDVYNQCIAIVKVVYEKMRKRRKWSAAAFDADFCAPVKKSKKTFIYPVHRTQTSFDFSSMK